MSWVFIFMLSRMIFTAARLADLLCRYVRKIFSVSPIRMSVYVPPHLKANGERKAPAKTAIEATDSIKVITNSPYGKLDSLESLSCAANLKFTTPTIIQKYAIPVVLNNHPLLCRAPTELGKTFCFLLPIMENLKFPFGIKACIVAPTRELCEQIKQETLKISDKIAVACAYGGVKYSSRNCQNANILVAAPGKLLDLLDRKLISLSTVTNFVLDEADKLLDMGFEREIRSIKAHVPASATVSLFSATYHKDLQSVINDFLPADRVTVEIQNETVENIKQVPIEVQNKSGKLHEILASKMAEDDKILVFVQQKITASKLENTIREWGHNVASIHGDKEQTERQQALNKFKSGEAKILVATSVAARGLDVNDVKLVINYDFPLDIKDYIHRIGRTGRQGKDGMAVSFITSDVSQEMRNVLIEVLKESKNEVPSFLHKTHTTQGGSKWGYEKTRKTPGPSSGRSHQRLEIAKELNELQISKKKDSEKEDSADDLPGAW